MYGNEPLGCDLLADDTSQSYLKDVTNFEGDASLSARYEVVLERVVVELGSHEDLEKIVDMRIIRPTVTRRRKEKENKGLGKMSVGDTMQIVCSNSTRLIN